MFGKVALGGLALFGVLLVAVVESTGCTCDGPELPSVELEIVDLPTACPGTVKVVAQHEDGATEARFCELQLLDGKCACSLGLGEGKPGVFVLDVTSADGLRTGKAEVEVSSGFCVIETERVKIDLQ